MTDLQRRISEQYANPDRHEYRQLERDAEAIAEPCGSCFEPYEPTAAEIAEMMADAPYVEDEPYTEDDCRGVDMMPPF